MDLSEKYTSRASLNFGHLSICLDFLILYNHLSPKSEKAMLSIVRFLYPYLDPVGQMKALASAKDIAMKTNPKQSLYFVLEGNDLTGKSSICIRLYNFLSEKFDSEYIVHARNPGATLIGAKIRQIMKYEHSIKLDPLTEQLLMLVDNSAFVNTLLIPALSQNKIIIADRSDFISAIVYGTCGGLSIDTVTQMLNLVKTPLIDLLFLFWCPWNVAKRRAEGREEVKCRFESRGDNFSIAINTMYANMCDEGSEARKLVNNYAKKVEVINAALSQEEVWYKIKEKVELVLATT